MALALVGFVVIFRNDGLVRQGNVAVHLVDDCISPGHCCRQILDSDFDVGVFASLPQRLFDESVVVRGPVRPYRQSGEYFVIGGEAGTPAEFMNERLIDLVTTAPLVQVKLCDGNEVVLLLHIQPDLSGDVLEQTLPVY